MTALLLLSFDIAKGIGIAATLGLLYSSWQQLAKSYNVFHFQTELTPIV